MYIFIDESGIHKPNGTSAIALIYLSIENMDNFQRAIVEIEKELKVEKFHWSHSSWSDKKKFIMGLSKEVFSIKVAIINNPFYGNVAYEYALQHLVIEHNIKAIVLDGNNEKSRTRNLKKVLRDKGISIKKIRTGRDESYPALRVADAIAGLVRYREEHPLDKQVQDLYQRITKKIVITFSE